MTTATSIYNQREPEARVKQSEIAHRHQSILFIDNKSLLFNRLPWTEYNVSAIVLNNVKSLLNVIFFRFVVTHDQNDYLKNHTM